MLGIAGVLQVEAAALAAVEGVVGAVAIWLSFRGDVWLELTGRATEAELPLWVTIWEMVQLLGALSLPIFGVLVWRGRPAGLFGGLLLQGAAVAVSGYRVVDTLPDTFWLIGFVAGTTILLAGKPVVLATVPLVAPPSALRDRWRGRPEPGVPVAGMRGTAAWRPAAAAFLPRQPPASGSGPASCG